MIARDDKKSSTSFFLQIKKFLEAVMIFQRHWKQLNSDGQIVYICFCPLICSCKFPILLLTSTDSTLVCPVKMEYGPENDDEKQIFEIPP